MSTIPISFIYLKNQYLLGFKIKLALNLHNSALAKTKIQQNNTKVGPVITYQIGQII